ncbi:MAG: HD domain-containing protein, partial [Actinomycetota bacterium]
DRTHLVAAAYLHDVGHSPALRTTGFHPLDGARYVRAAGHERLAGLVAHHSEARFQAELLGYSEALAEFPREVSETADALAYCDLTTGPSGGVVTFEERIEELFNRYAPESIVLEALRRAMPDLAKAVGRTERRLARIGVG